MPMTRKPAAQGQHCVSGKHPSGFNPSRGSGGISSSLQRSYAKSFSAEKHPIRAVHEVEACSLTEKSGHIIMVIIIKETIVQKIAAARFKAQCLAVMDQVSQSGRPVVITKHGKAVVKLVPVNESADEIFGALAGIARITGDIENTVPARDWGVE
jgi:prevent-host-death family protein